MRNVRTLLFAAAAIGQFGLAARSFAQQPQATEVDVELVLAVDVSQSMDFDEHTLQRLGYVEAFRSRDVIDAIASGKRKRIAIAYVEWAGTFPPMYTIPWTIIDGAAAARAFADRLAVQPIYGEKETSISNALYNVASSIEGNNIASQRQIINVSGDGANAVGPPVEKARDDVVKRGIVINGLPMMLNHPMQYYDIPQLDRYYEHCVIGGEGAFVAPVTRREDVTEATRKALAGGKGATPPAVSSNQPRMDCMAGEKAWASAPPQRN